jgi:hypothetical protein
MAFVMTPDEIFEAVAAAATGPELPAVATPDAVTAAELAIGYPLPPLLRRLYLELGNGGFGPRNAITGVLDEDFEHGDIFPCINDSAVANRNDPDERMAGMVDLLEWGCRISTLLDCRDPAGQMWGLDPYLCCREHALFPMDITFSQWLADSIGQKYDDLFYDGYSKGKWRTGSENASGSHVLPVWVKGRRLR